MWDDGPAQVKPRAATPTGKVRKGSASPGPRSSRGSKSPHAVGRNPSTGVEATLRARRMVMDERKAKGKDAAGALPKPLPNSRAMGPSSGNSQVCRVPQPYTRSSKP